MGAVAGKGTRERRVARNVQATFPLTVVVEHDRENGWFVSTIREFPGFISPGRTFESATRNVLAEFRHFARNHADELVFMSAAMRNPDGSPKD